MEATLKEVTSQVLPAAISRTEVDEFLKNSKFPYPLVHYSLDADGLKKSGFELQRRGSGLESRNIEPLGISLVDPQSGGYYANEETIEDKLEWMREQSPTAGRVEIAANVATPLVVEEFEDLWASDFYKQAIERMGYEFEKGGRVFGTGDFIEDTSVAGTDSTKTKFVSHEQLKKNLTEILRQAGYDSVVINQIGEVIVLDPENLRIITD